MGDQVTVSDNAASIAALPTDVVVASQGSQLYNPALHIGAAAAFLPSMSVTGDSQFSANTVADDGKTAIAGSLGDQALEKPSALTIVSTTDQANANLIINADGKPVWNKPLDGKGTMSVYRAEQTSDEQYKTALTSAKSELENGKAKTIDGKSVSGDKKYTFAIPETLPVDLTKTSNTTENSNNSATNDDANSGSDDDPVGADNSCGGVGSGGGGKGPDGPVDGTTGPETKDTKEANDNDISSSGKGLSEVTNKMYSADQWQQPARFINSQTIANFANNKVPSVMMNAMMGFDKNGDGQLDADELAEWEKWKAAHPEEVEKLEKSGSKAADTLAKEGSPDAAKGVNDFVNGMKADSTKDGTFINDFYRTMKAAKDGNLNSDTFTNNSAFTPAFQKAAGQTTIIGRLNEAIPNWRKEPLSDASLKVLRDTLAKDAYKY